MKFKNVLTKSVLALSSVIILAGCDLFGPSTPPVKPEPPKPEPPVATLKTDSDIKKIIHDELGVSYKIISDTDANREMLFKDIANSQLEILTNNIIYRLTTIYGGGLVGSQTGDKGDVFVNLKDPNTGLDLVNNGRNVSVSSHSVIAKPSSTLQNKPVYKVGNQTLTNTTDANINELETFAHSLQDGEWSSETVLTSKLNLKNAMTNWNMSLSAGLKNNLEFNSKDVIYEDFYAQNFTSIKTKLANAIANTNNLTYENAIDNIKSLNIATNTLQIKNVILNDIIGANNVTTDTRNKPTTTILKTNTTLTAAQKEYKAYELLVTNIANVVSSQTYNDSSISVWKVVHREATESELFKLTSSNTVSSNNYTSVIINTKTFNTGKVTKLTFSVSGQLSNSDLEITLNAKSVNGSYNKNNVSISKTSLSDIVIDFDALKISPTSDGVIELLFNNKTSNAFTIKFSNFSYLS